MAGETEVPLLLSAFIGVCSAGGVKLAERLIGWFFERNKGINSQRDGDIAVVKSVVFEVRDLASGYWSMDGKQPERQAAIAGRLFFIGAVIDELFEKNEQLLRECHVVMNRFDVACTSGNFGSASRQAQPERISNIEVSAYTLVHTVERSRRKL